MKLQLAIQHIEIVWGKESRGTHRTGADRATMRNALPRTAPFDPPGEAADGWFQHIKRVSWDEDFTPREQWQRIEDADRARLPIRWKQEGDFVQIGLRNLRLQKPDRPHLRSQFFAKLPIGQRLILHVNAAYDWGGYPRDYFEHVLSVGVAPVATLDLPLFRAIDERALLF